MAIINRSIHMVIFFCFCLYSVWLSYTFYRDIVFISTKRSTEAIIETRNDEGPEYIMNAVFFNEYLKNDVHASFVVDKQLFNQMKTSTSVNVSYGENSGKSYVSHYKEPGVGSLVVSFITLLIVLSIDVLYIRKFIRRLKSVR